MLDGVIACIVWAGFSLFSMPLLNLACRVIDQAQGCSLLSLHPLLTLIAPMDPNWPFNRLFWLVAGVLLVTASLRLVHREERLMYATRVE
jgi:hypothetical protein